MGFLQNFGKQASVYEVVSHKLTLKTQKRKTNLNTRKLMATDFWDWKGFIHVKFMLKGITINSEAYPKQVTWIVVGKDGFDS